MRDQYWQPGGIPKEKRAEALKTMREVFTGAGLEVMLIDMGLNPGAIAFAQLNGAMGKIGNIGVAGKIKAEQDAYQHALEERLATYVQQEMISQERADWVKAGIEAMKHGEKQTAPVDIVKETMPETAVKVQPGTKFSDKAPRKNSIEELIQRSEKAGDWREAAQLSKEHLAPPAVGG